MFRHAFRYRCFASRGTVTVPDPPRRFQVEELSQRQKRLTRIEEQKTRSTRILYTLSQKLREIDISLTKRPKPAKRVSGGCNIMLGLCVFVCVCVRACVCTLPIFSVLPFSAVSLCGVAGLAETFPSFPVRGPFLPDVPGFQVPPDCTLPPQLRSSSRVLPLHLHFDNCSDVFSFISSFNMPEPFQPSSIFCIEDYYLYNASRI